MEIIRRLCLQWGDWFVIAVQIGGKCKIENLNEKKLNSKSKKAIKQISIYIFELQNATWKPYVLLPPRPKSSFIFTLEPFPGSKKSATNIATEWLSQIYISVLSFSRSRLLGRPGWRAHRTPRLHPDLQDPLQRRHRDDQQVRLHQDRVRWNFHHLARKSTLRQFEHFSSSPCLFLMFW